MAYNSYFPAGYQPVNYPQYPQAYPQQNPMQANPQQIYPQSAPNNQNGIIWVQGIEGAKAHPVNAGQSALLMDSEGDCFYLKSADQTGMPTLRVFDYKERTSAPTEQKNGDFTGFATKDDLSLYVTKDELKSAISEFAKKGKKKDE